MTVIYEHGDYYIKKNRVYPKTGLPILNKNTDEHIFSLYPYTDDKSLHLSYANLAKRVLRDDSEEAVKNLSPEQFHQALICARKHAIETNQNLILEPELAETFDVQNFVLYKDKDTHESELKDNFVPMTASEIESINHVGQDVNVKFPNHISSTYNITKARTENHDSHNITIYVVSSGSINFDINAKKDHHRTILLKNKDFDFSNIASLKNSGDYDKAIVKFPAISLKKHNENCLYKMPQHIDKHIICTLSSNRIYKNIVWNREPSVREPRTYGYDMLPKQIVNNAPNITFGDRNSVLDRTLEFARYLFKDTYEDTDSEIKSLNNVIGLYENHPHMFKEENTDEKINELKTIRNNLNITHRNEFVPT